MSTEPKPAIPVILVPRKCLSSTAIRELKAAGYLVIQAANVEAVKQFHATDFKTFSDEAKLKAFENALSQKEMHFTKTDLRAWYIHFLQQAGGF